MRRLYTDSQINSLIGNKISGTNDGTNWTKIKINGVEKNIPSGGGTQLYKHVIKDSSDAEVCKIFTTKSSQYTSITDVNTSWNSGEILSMNVSDGTSIYKCVGTVYMSESRIKLLYCGSSFAITFKDFTSFGTDTVTEL